MDNRRAISVSQILPPRSGACRPAARTPRRTRVRLPPGLLLGGALAGLGTLPPHQAAAQAPAFTISGGFEDTAPDNGVPSFSLGYTFTANAAVTVTALGYYDDGQALTHMQQSHPVGIFDAGGTLLVQGTVTPADPLGDLFRYTDVLADGQGQGVTTVTLLPGRTYTAAAVTGADEYEFLPDSFAGDPAVSYGEDRFAVSSTLLDPTRTDHNVIAGFTGPAYFGPNFRLAAPAAAAPEPSGLAAFALGAVGVLGLAWRRRAPARH